MAPVHVHVIYCGVWNHAPKYEKLRLELLDTFGADIEVTGEATPQKTGRFDVQIVGGKLLHSKKAGGEGHVDTPEKLEKIKKGIEEALKAQAEWDGHLVSSLGDGSTDDGLCWNSGHGPDGARTGPCGTPLNVQSPHSSYSPARKF